MVGRIATMVVVSWCFLTGVLRAAEPTFDLFKGEPDGLRLAPDGVVELTANDTYPSLTLRAPGGRWDLSGTQFLEVDVTNEWTKPLMMT